MSETDIILANTKIEFMNDAEMLRVAERDQARARRFLREISSIPRHQLTSAQWRFLCAIQRSDWSATWGTRG